VVSNDVVWAIAHDEFPELRRILETLLNDEPHEDGGGFHADWKLIFQIA